MDFSRMNVCAFALFTAALTAVSCDPLPKRSLLNAVMDPQGTVERHLGLAGSAPAPVKRVTNRKPNPNGRTLILEYHKLSRKSGELDRTPVKFRADLEKLYKLGYRPVTVSEWIDGTMSLPPGASPVILTFDDAHPSQLKFKKDGTLDPNCFVAIWKAFAEKHPDF